MVMDDRDARRDDRILYAVIAAIGLIPIVITLAHGRAFGAESTIGAGMFVLALIGFATSWRIAQSRR